MTRSSSLTAAAPTLVPAWPGRGCPEGSGVRESPRMGQGCLKPFFQLRVCREKKSPPATRKQASHWAQGIQSPNTHQMVLHCPARGRALRGLSGRHTHGPALYGPGFPGPLREPAHKLPMSAPTGHTRGPRPGHQHKAGRIVGAQPVCQV